MYSLRMIKKPYFLNAYSTFSNMFMTSWRSLIPSTRSYMINIGCHTSFMWVTMFGHICRKNALPKLIRSSYHSDMGCTPLPRLRETIILSSTLANSLAYTQCSRWTAFNHTFHHYWTQQKLQNNSHQQS